MTNLGCVPVLCTARLYCINSRAAFSFQADEFSWLLQTRSMVARCTGQPDSGFITNDIMQQSVYLCVCAAGLVLICSTGKVITVSKHWLITIQKQMTRLFCQNH